MERGNLYQKRDKTLRDKFNGIAKEYEQFRFDYPFDLYESIFSFASEGKKAMEIGIGTGKATTPFLEKDYEIVAIEPVHNMLEIAREKYKGKRIIFINSTFEDISDTEQFDLIYAASSFQWINECDRLGKVFKLLKVGGAFARFKTVNIIDEKKNENNKILIEAYTRYLPEYLPCDIHKKHMKDEEYIQAGFKDLQREEFYVDHVFEAETYLKLVNTYTEYIALPLDVRKNFEKFIIENLFGKMVVITQKCTLFLAKK